MKWYPKQLLPLKYKTTYGMNGKQHSCEWRMWFGRCFAIDDRILGDYHGIDFVSAGE